MEHHRGYRPFVFVVAAIAVLMGIALLATPAGVAQDASPEASPSACPEASPNADATPAANATPCPDATPQQGAASEVIVESHDIFFEPKEFSIPAGADVTANLPNLGVTLHNFSITDHKNPDLAIDPIDVDIDPGATEHAGINAPAGEYYFFCNVPGHEAAGMWGTMTVE